MYPPYLALQPEAPVKTAPFPPPLDPAESRQWWAQQHTRITQRLNEAKENR